MTYTISRTRMSVSSLDTSYSSLAGEQGMRSPRTPTYQPDSPLICAGAPFDPTRILHGTAENKPLSPRPPPPNQPMAWIWICHLCHSRYALGVTRRCLVDGHYYCSGETDFPSLRKKKKNKSCSSEFDYGAWGEWGDWRRKVLGVMKNERLLKGCEKCDFPSQCRYPVGSHPLGQTETPVKVSSSKGIRQGKKSDVPTRSSANANVDFDQILQSMIPDADSDKQNPSKSSTKEQGGKSTRKGRKKAVYTGAGPSLEEEMAKEDKRLRELVGLDLWTSLEDVELEKAKIE